MGENIGEFGELMDNSQSFLPQIYGIFNIHILICSSRDLSGTMMSLLKYCLPTNEEALER